MPVEGELLGDARLRQGLTYYPAVYVKEQVVAVGNVVKIQRLTGAGKPDISFGHLKGIWLWRDKPYIRVQYLAPVLANPPEESIAFKGTPSAGATEVLITSKVADLPLDVLVRSVPIFFSQGELTAQVFQRNVPLSNGPHLQCTRLVDSSLKVAALLDRGFQLLPLAQSFGSEVIHAVCGLEYEEEEDSLLGLPRGVGLPVRIINQLPTSPWPLTLTLTPARQGGTLRSAPGPPKTANARRPTRRERRYTLSRGEWT